MPDEVFEQSRMPGLACPGSRFLILDSGNHLLLERDPAWRQFLAEVDAFLEVPAEPPGG